MKAELKSLSTGTTEIKLGNGIDGINYAYDLLKQRLLAGCQPDPPRWIPVH
jgi:hypothetical protein